MEITITHARYTPSWETLQQMIREATNEPNGRLIRINRTDRGVDYRSPGNYQLEFEQSNDAVLPITLNVVAVGQTPQPPLARNDAPYISREEVLTHFRESF